LPNTYFQITKIEEKWAIFENLLLKQWILCRVYTLSGFGDQEQNLTFGRW